MRREAAVWIEGDDVDGGNQRNGVHRDVVVGDIATVGLGEEVGRSGIARSVPHADGHVLCVLERESLVVELAAAAAHHVEEDAQTGCVAGTMGVLAPILRTETPGIFIVAGGFGCPVGSTVVFGIKANEVDAESRIEPVDVARQFEHHRHARCAIVGRHDRQAVLRGVGVLVGPGAGVVVGRNDDAVFGFGLVGGNDVAAAQRGAVPTLEGGLLLGDVKAVTAEFGDDIVAAALNGGGVGRACAEIALCLNETESRIGVELHLAHQCGVNRRGVAGGLASFAGHEQRREAKEEEKFRVHILLGFVYR